MPLNSSSSSSVECRALSGALLHCEYLQGTTEAWLKTGQSNLKQVKHSSVLSSSDRAALP